MTFALGALVLAAGCRPSEPSVFVVVAFDAALEVKQFTFLVEPEGQAPLAELHRPEEPGEPLASPQSLRILLPDELAGRVVQVTVVARAGESDLGRASGAVTVAARGEVRLDLDLSAPSARNCTNTAHCPPGHRCVQGLCVCDAQSCPAGCCDESGCRTRAHETCGPSGESCFACDARANGCDATGACSCGGMGACTVGQRCVAGQCVCDGLSCAGCCDGLTCRVGTTAELCGSGGADCTACPAGEACTAEGACSGCDAVSCSGGCCSGVCQPSTFLTCGIGGGPCKACDQLTANGCSANGSCRCGLTAACAAEQQCVEGQCICTDESCAGCCTGTSCLPGTTNDNCGSRGDPCRGCERGNTCVSGECRCGANPACPSPKLCVGNTCV